LARSRESPVVIGAATGGPSVVEPGGATDIDEAAGGRLISPGPGNVMAGKGAELDTHDEHPPDVT